MVKLWPALRVRPDSAFILLSRVPPPAPLPKGNGFAALPIGARLYLNSPVTGVFGIQMPV